MTVINIMCADTRRLLVSEYSTPNFGVIHLNIDEELYTIAIPDSPAADYLDAYYCERISEAFKQMSLLLSLERQAEQGYRIKKEL